MLTSSVAEAAENIRQGHLVGIPTETVYGLADRINNENSLREIFRRKNRPFFDPLIVHVSSIEMASDLVKQWPPTAQALAQRFWPGPLSLVLEKSEKVSSLISSGLSTVALRIPNHPMTLKLIEMTGPLAAPSANLFGMTSPTTAEHVEQTFPDLVILDGGPCTGGIESTVFDVETHSVLRPGLINAKQLGAMIGAPVKIQPSNKSPGHTPHHYMPVAPLVVAPVSWPIDAVKTEIGLREPGFLNRPISQCQLNDQPTLAARELYNLLRQHDLKDGLILMRVPDHTQDQESDELWGAIFDWLKRAAKIIITK